MKKALAGLTVGLLAAVVTVPAGATTYPSFKITSTVIGPGPLRLVVHQLDATHTAINIKDAKRVVNGRTYYVLRHLVCRSNSTWRLPTRAVGSCTGVSSYGFGYWRTQYVPEVTWSGTRYHCSRLIVVTAATKTFSCLLTNPNTPRASHGTGFAVLGSGGAVPAATPRDTSMTAVPVSITGVFPSAVIGIYEPGGYSVLYPTVTNNSGTQAIVNTMWVTSITSDSAACPASWFTVGGPVTVGAVIAPSDGTTAAEASLVVTADGSVRWEYLPTFRIDFTPPADASVSPGTCQHARVVFNLESN